MSASISAFVGSATFRWLLRALVILLGILWVWKDRNYLSMDGVAYLDLSEIWWSTDWRAAVNGLWSPLYPLLLGLWMKLFPSSIHWELTFAHLLNFLFYLGAFGCFEFLLRQLEIALSRTAEKNNEPMALPSAMLPFPLLRLIACILFVWSACRLDGLSRIAPDLLMTALVYLNTALLLRIHNGQARTRTIILFGLSLGIGYLAKTPMLPLSAVWLFGCLISLQPLKVALTKTALAAGVMLLTIAPFVTLLSFSVGKFTVGESARLNYLWHINNLPDRHWQGEDPSAGKPLHPTRQVMQNPDLYEYIEPIRGTYPVWLNPVYWYAGVESRVALSDLLRQNHLNFTRYLRLFVSKTTIALPLLLIACLWYGRRRWQVMTDIVKSWPVLLSALAGLLMFLPVHVELRYVIPFVTLLWLGLFASLRATDPGLLPRLMILTVLAVSPLLAETMLPAWKLVRPASARTEPYIEMAEFMRQQGYHPGSRVAIAGDVDYSGSFRWARLARVRIVAENAHHTFIHYHEADDAAKQKMIEFCRGFGVVALVAEIKKADMVESGWQKCGNTNYYLLDLRQQ